MKDAPSEAVFVNVYESYESVRSFCEFMPIATIQDVGMEEAAFRRVAGLLEGLGVGKFVYGRKGQITRFEWGVPNPKAVGLKQDATFGVFPRKARGKKTKDFTVSVKFVFPKQLVPVLREQIAEDLTKENVGEWVRSTMYALLEEAAPAQEAAS
jgi:hypothetical protein